MADDQALGKAASQLTRDCIQAAIILPSGEIIGAVSKPVLSSVFVSKTPFEGKLVTTYRGREGWTALVYLVPNGRDDIWRIFVHWLAHREMPSGTSTIQLIRCWCTGDEYGIPVFQDGAMIKLLRYFEKRIARVHRSFLHEAFDRAVDQGVELQALLLEELVKGAYHYDTELDIQYAGLSDGDLLPAFVRTHKRFIRDKDSFFNRFTKRYGHAAARWEDFLVPGGIKKAWHRDKTGEPILGKKRKWDEIE